MDLSHYRTKGWGLAQLPCHCCLPSPCISMGSFYSHRWLKRSVYKGWRPLSDKPQPQTSVGDPDPQDPHVFGPAETGSDPLVRGMDPGTFLLRILMYCIPSVTRRGNTKLNWRDRFLKVLCDIAPNANNFKLRWDDPKMITLYVTRNRDPTVYRKQHKK